jgi:hypothetical protein
LTLSSLSTQLIIFVLKRVELVKDTTFDLQATLVPGAGTVEFTSAPGVNLSGAHVFLDDVDKGAAPIRLPSPGAGNHRWKVVQPGHEPAEGTIDVVPGRNYLFPVTLESSAGVVAVTTKPAGARVAKVTAARSPTP